jgi:hypothetical protein
MLVIAIVPNSVPYATYTAYYLPKILLFPTRVFISLYMSLYAHLKYPSKSNIEWKIEFNFSGLLEILDFVTILHSYRDQ